MGGCATGDRNLSGFRQKTQMKMHTEQMTLLDMPADQRQSAPASKRAQPERALMGDVIRAARSIGVMALHIVNFCGNRFWVTCPQCGHKALAECRHVLYGELVGQPDIIVVGAGIELKHANGRLSPMQENRREEYRSLGIPHLVANETDGGVLRFLSEQKRGQLCVPK